LRTRPPTGQPPPQGLCWLQFSKKDPLDGGYHPEYQKEDDQDDGGCNSPLDDDIPFLVVFSVTYDNNSNMIQRTENGQTCVQDFDAENRLTKVTANGQITKYLYDGQGNLVKREYPGGVFTQYYFGCQYAIIGSEALQAPVLTPSPSIRPPSVPSTRSPPAPAAASPYLRGSGRASR
jgi:YD repeat-containing protein